MLKTIIVVLFDLRTEPQFRLLSSLDSWRVLSKGIVACASYRRWGQRLDHDARLRLAPSEGPHRSLALTVIIQCDIDFFDDVHFRRNQLLKLIDTAQRSRRDSLGLFEGLPEHFGLGPWRQTGRTDYVVVAGAVVGIIVKVLGVVVLIAWWVVLVGRLLVVILVQGFDWLFVFVVGGRLLRKNEVDLVVRLRVLKRCRVLLSADLVSWVRSWRCGFLAGGWGRHRALGRGGGLNEDAGLDGGHDFCAVCLLIRWKRGIAAKHS